MDEEKPRKVDVDEVKSTKKLVISIAFLIAVLIGVVGIVAILAEGEETSDPRYYAKTACVALNPTPMETNACLYVNCSFDPSICGSLCPFGYMNDEKTKCQLSCECAEQGLFQGDIRFGPLDIKRMAEQYGYIKKEEEDFSLFYGSVYSQFTTLWVKYEVNGRYQIPYTMIPEMSKHGSIIETISKGIEMISKSTCIDIVPRTDEPHYILITNDAGCSSYTGMVDHETPQKVSLGSGCYNSRTVHHEFKHLIAFQHEHVRSDRDAYLIVRLENVVKGMEHNFVRISKDNVVKSGVPYDIDSVMQYTSGSFSNGFEKWTVVKRNEETIAIQNYDIGYSEYDAFEINQLYDCLDLVQSAKWTSWGEWSGCDATCEEGERFKYRRCEDANGNQVLGCEGDPYIAEPCLETDECPPPRGEWSDWGPWEECSRTCGMTVRFRSRDCSIFKQCPKETSKYDSELCDFVPCDDDDTSGSVITWGQWSDCSATCNGQRIRTQVCTGSECNEDNKESEPCNTVCPSPTSVYESWGQWSSCTKTCDGSKSRQKMCSGVVCPESSSQIEECNVGRCGTSEDWTWSNWGQCSATCEGSRERYKICGASVCEGDSKVTEDCNTIPCVDIESYTTTTSSPSSGGQWELWSSCTATCDGTRVRKKSCASTFCYNQETETENCNVGYCSSGGSGSSGGDAGGEESIGDENTSIFDVNEGSIPSNLCSNTYGSRWYFGDFNGDKRTDAMCVGTDGSVALGHTSDRGGTLTELHWKDKISSCAGADIYIADVNGDNKDDMVCKDSNRRKLTIKYATQEGVFDDKETDGGGFCTDSADKLILMDADGSRTIDILCHFADNHIELKLNNRKRPYQVSM